MVKMMKMVKNSEKQWCVGGPFGTRTPYHTSPYPLPQPNLLSSPYPLPLSSYFLPLTLGTYTYLLLFLFAPLSFSSSPLSLFSSLSWFITRTDRRPPLKELSYLFEIELKQNFLKVCERENWYSNCSSDMLKLPLGFIFE